MSSRPRSSRSVVTLIVLSALASVLLLQVFAQSLGDLVAPAADRPLSNTVEEKINKDITEELFPYASMSKSGDIPALDLISASTYPFTSQNGVALEDMSSGTTQLLGPNLDDTASAVTNIGFDFWYDGVRHSQFSVNVNGLARLGSTVIGTTFNNSTDGLGTVTNAPKIAAYFEDSCTGAAGKVHYKVLGSAPNRRLVVEWVGMETPRDGSCGTGPANAVFQMWLIESASATNPGRIQFVYGGGILPSDDTDLGASVGLQSGVATNFASVTLSDDTVSYTVANNTNLGGIAAGKSYAFTPANLPAAPSGLGISPITQLTAQLNWTDNATNEVGYAVYRSTDNVNFTFITQTAADAVSYTDTGLLPGVQYFYNVYAVSEGALSAPASTNGTTLPAGNISCNGAGGNWSSTASWTGGVVPAGGDNVTIGSGCTITIDVAAPVLSLTVQAGGVLEFESATARTMTVTLAVTNAGTIRSNAAGTVTTHMLSVGTDFTNDGVLDFSTNSDTAGAELRFTGAANNSFSGTGATTDLRLLTIQKGAGNVNTSSPTLDVNLSNMSVRGLTTGATGGFLNTTVFNGIVKFSGTNTLSDNVFTAAAYTIPITGGVWFNNPNFTVAGQNGSPTTNGLLRITNGVFNVGTSAGNSMGGGTGAQFIIEGGTANFAGRLQTTSSVSYTQSGGTVNVCTVGNTATTASFGLTSTTNTFNMTGGTIVLVNPNTNATPLDYSVSTTAVFTANPAGTTLQLGAVSTPATTFRVLGATPNILISTGQTMAVGSGAAGGAIFFRGSTVTNNGAIVIQGTGASSRFDFAANGPMTYGGTGTFGTAGTSFAGVGMSANGGTTTINSPIFINRVNIFTGGFINSNQITLGNGGTSTTLVQVGNSTTPTAAGTFDVSPVYNSGSGGHIALNLRTTTLNRVTGFEINPTRTLATWTLDDNAVGGTLTIAGGNVSVPGTFNLTNGVLVTGASTVTNNGTVARTAGFVDGNLSRDFTAPGTYTYHVGDGGGYSPVAANVTAGTGSLTVSAIATAQPNIPTPSKALSRHWKLSGSGITSDLTFTYLDPADIPVTATEANFVIQKYDGTFTQPGGTVNTAANTASITGVTSFSDWTLAEPGALVAPGVLALSSATYSANENAGTILVTVNRTAGTDGAVGVDYTLSGGTATGGAACGAGIDYVNTGGTVSFTDGQSSNSFSVTLCGDTDVEADETFNITLSNPTGGATLGSPATAVATILNDDAPSGGPVTVTATAGTTGPTDYATLSAAIAAINAGTHQGVINVAINTNTTEPGSIVINSSGAGAASYTSLTIRPSVDGVTVAGPTVQGRGLIELNGADNVDINGDNPNSGGTNRNLTLHNTAANTVTFTSVVRIALAATIVTTADNNQFRNLNLVGSATGRNIAGATTTTGTENTTFGIFVGPGASAADATAPPAAVTSVSTGVPAAATATSLNISNNSVVTAARGVSVNAAAVANFPGLQISGNTIGNPVASDPNQVTAVGITASGSADGIIRNNTVWVEGFVGSSAAGHGISVGVNGAFGTFLVELNKVNRVRNSHPGTFSAFGINLGGSTNHVVQNNFISGMSASQVTGTAAFSATFGSFGIRVGSGTGHKVYHNSVHLYGAIPGTTSTYLTAGLVIATVSQTGVDVRNNIFSNQLTGGNPTGARHAAIALPTSGTSAMNLTLNNNAYFVGTGPLNRLAQVGFVFGSGEFQPADFDPTSTTPATNLRAYTSTLSAAGTNDNASFATTAPPPFTSDSDLHIPAGTATRLESGGAAVGVTTDIDLEARNATTPDIGADEFAGNPAPANDIAASSFVTPADGSTIQTGSLTPQARFVNNGTAVQTNVTVRFRIFDSGMTTIYNQTATIASINPLQVVTVTFPSTTIPSPGAYTMTASSELVGDANPGNDSINGSFNAVSPISGTVTVGTGGDFTSLTNAGGLFQALNIAGISSNLTVNIITDLTSETGAFALNELAESGAGGYTVTFKPSGAARVISGTPPSGSGLIKLNGADRIVFDGSLSGGTDRSLTVTNNQGTTSTVFWIAAASASNGANSNTIKNCIINGATGATATTTVGVIGGSGTTLGNAAEAPNNNNTIQNNEIYRVQNSVYNQGNAGLDQNWTITGNVMGRAAPGGDRNSFRGMLMGNAQNFVISNNTIQGVSVASTTAGIHASGIQIAFSVNGGQITGNRISDLRQTGTQGTYGIHLSGTATLTNVTIANNFIWDLASVGSATVANNGHGIIFNGTTAATAFKIYHNSIHMSASQGSGTMAAMHVAGPTAAGALDVRNNIFSNPAQGGATRFGIHSTAAAAVFSPMNGNDYFAQNVGFIGGSARPTLADWQAATGQDANSLAVDPLFVSATDLHLQLSSPLRNQGVTGTGITTDIDGETRDANPDIGADELQIVGNPGSLQFSSATYSVGEAGPVAVITVTRTGGSDGTVGASYASSNGTATGGASCGGSVDYVNTSGIVTFPNGVTSQTFNVPICQDPTDEPDETVNLALTLPTGGAVIGSPSSAVLTITDDDIPVVGSISINDVRAFEGNAGAVNFVFTVTYSGSSAPASVQYATASGTAVSGVDFLPASGTLTFGGPISPEGIPGPQTRTITVVVNSEVVKEANEIFFVNLSSPVGVNIVDGQGVGIIIDEDRAYVADFDRDLETDVSVFRPSNGVWYVRESTSKGAAVVAFGQSGDVPVPGDYDGDGLADYAVWRPSDGVWYRILSSDSSVASTAWGASTDKPVQGDYDGDGKTDLAIFRPSTGEWWVLRSSTGTSSTAIFGQAGDRPIQGDYDGDARTDLAVFRNGTWHIARSSGTVLSVVWGISTDLPVSGDFDGDGKFDLAVYRNGVWWIFRSLTGEVQAVNWGSATDVPTPGDYDGDGTTDVMIFRPSNGSWIGLRSSNGSTFGLVWGISEDLPIPAAYVHPE